MKVMYEKDRISYGETQCDVPFRSFKDPCLRSKDPKV